MTNRLREALIALGLATSAQVSERLAPKLAMGGSAPTLLRRLRTLACPAPTSVRILGVDAWAWKKGQSYGTILVELQKGRPSARRKRSRPGCARTRKSRSLAATAQERTPRQPRKALHKPSR